MGRPKLVYKSTGLSRDITRIEFVAKKVMKVTTDNGEINIVNEFDPDELFVVDFNLGNKEQSK